VTCGVLNEGDSDTGVAEALEIQTVCERPFSPIGQAAMDRAREVAKTADALVVCGVPFGPGNVVNLELAEQALAAGKPVFLMEGVAERDYTPAREATARAAALGKAGAQPWASIADLLTRLPSKPQPTAESTAARGGAAS
jgi:iron complex transport system ATP-binding protein